MSDNVLYCGDNLDVLRRHINDETVDLVYLDSPFDSSSDLQNGMASGRNSERDQEANRLCRRLSSRTQS